MWKTRKKPGGAKGLRFDTLWKTKEKYYKRNGNRVFHRNEDFIKVDMWISLTAAGRPL